MNRVAEIDCIMFAIWVNQIIDHYYFNVVLLFGYFAAHSLGAWACIVYVCILYFCDINIIVWMPSNLIANIKLVSLFSAITVRYLCTYTLKKLNNACIARIVGTYSYLFMYKDFKSIKLYGIETQYFQYVDTKQSKSKFKHNK